MTEYKTFGEMSKEEQLTLFVAWQEGKEIEVCASSQWYKVQKDRFAFFVTNAYRIAAPKPFFDFSPFNEKWKWVAKCKGGAVYLYKNKPVKTGINWGEMSGYVQIREDTYPPCITNLFDPSIPWQESLVAREGVE